VIKSCHRLDEDVDTLRSMINKPFIRHSAKLD